jgi:caffeoyl-CoA O-methyltransferase
MSTTDHKAFGTASLVLSAFVRETYRTTDPVLAEIEQRAAAAGLPAIHVCDFDARHLEVIARAIGAQMVIEIGTLAGLSGVSLARALPPDGMLHTFEMDPRHAEVAEESFRHAGVIDKVAIHVGRALETLPLVEPLGPFDLVFIDADKPGYPGYLDWAARNLRVGGVVLADNAFRAIEPPADESGWTPEFRRNREALTAFNEALGDPDGPWRATMIPTGEGLAMGVRVR